MDTPATAVPNRETIIGLDAADPLRALRDAFQLPDGVIYMDGNSLGALPKSTPGRLESLIRDQWGTDLIRSWNTHDWFGAPQRIGAKIAPLIGAADDEVVVADSTSVNLFKLVAGAAALRPRRGVILTEPGNFPTDLYILQGLAEVLAGRVTIRTVPREDLAGAIDEDTAVVVLTHVHYKTAERWPMAEISGLARQHGALTVWDLSHSAGALAVDLDRDGADLALGCGYKYLNGGPGAPSFAFVARRWQDSLPSPLCGWMGHARPFDFVDDFAPAAGIRRQVCGTPGMLGLAALESGVDQFARVDMSTVEAKGLALGQLFIALVESRPALSNLRLISPREPSRRGSHVSFVHPEGYAIMQALISRGVIGDFRAPDALRFGFTPLYLGYEDIWRAVDILEAVIASEAFREPRFQVRAAVT